MKERIWCYSTITDGRLEEACNEFLSECDGNLSDIKFSISDEYVAICVVYIPKESENK